jgi:hypothetical protein
VITVFFSAGAGFTMGAMQLEFDAELWIWDARPGDHWTFVSLPVDASDEIRDVTGGQRRGFGAVRVEARVGATTWRTSIFPDAKQGAYVLPVKKAVRKAHHLEAGDTVRVAVELINLPSS